MNVRLFSDLHLEFSSKFDPGTGDVLVLAGDITTTKNVLTAGVRNFFNKCVQGYNKVFYVMGNHEYYDGDVNTSVDVIRRNIPEEIVLLNNSSEFYRGIHFMGATMWANFNNRDSKMMDISEMCMNDYNIVANNSPELSLERFDDTMMWFKKTLPNLLGPVFVITHHAPSFQSISGRYNNELSGAYATDLEDFILKNTKIKHWVHGHIHRSSDYKIGQCRVMTNPHGYYPHEVNERFDPNFTLHLPSLETGTSPFTRGIK